MTTACHGQSVWLLEVVTLDTFCVPSLALALTLGEEEMALLPMAFSEEGLDEVGEIPPVITETCLA